MSSPQNMLAWKIFVIIAHFCALSSTLVRIHHRWKIRQLWWDDYLVVVPWLFDLAAMTLFFVQYTRNTIQWDDTQYNGFLFSWWLICFIGVGIIWQSRISMAFSVARIFMPGHFYRTVALSFAGLLLVFQITSMAVMTTMCRGSPWYDLKMKSCLSGSSKTIGFIPALLFSFDLGSDLCLVAVPLLMLWKIRFPRSERTLILSLFSSSILTLLATVLYCGLFEFLWSEGSNSRLLFVSLGHLQASLSLLAANLLVVSMLVYKLIRDRHNVPKRGPVQQNPAAPGGESSNHDQPPVLEQPPAITHITLTIMSDQVRFTDHSFISYDRHSVPFPSQPVNLPLDGRRAISLP